MRVRSLFLLPALIAVLAVACGPTETTTTEPMEPAMPAMTATANLINSMGEPAGTAMLTSEPGDGVRIELDYMGLTPGTHALHIHTTGTCEPPDFTSAGGHFNPYGRQHGLENPMGPHAGDLPNFDVDATGSGHVSTVASMVTLGEGENSLFHPGGTALVIHAMADDNMTDPAGAAGPRVACGVIEH